LGFFYAAENGAVNLNLTFLGRILPEVLILRLSLLEFAENHDSQ